MMVVLLFYYERNYFGIKYEYFSIITTATTTITIILQKLLIFTLEYLFHFFYRLNI